MVAWDTLLFDEILCMLRAIGREICKNYLVGREGFVTLQLMGNLVD